MTTKVFQTSETLIAGLTGIWPLASVAAQVTLQVCLPLHCVRAKWTLEAHNRVCNEEDNLLCHFLNITTAGYLHASPLLMNAFFFK